MMTVTFTFTLLQTGKSNLMVLENLIVFVTGYCSLL